MTAGRRVNTASTHWNTPPKYVDAVKEVFGDIDLDPCSNDMSVVGATVELGCDGLECDWGKYKTVYVNPPFGRGIADWLKKCNESSTEILALIPVATNTKHWKDYVFHATSICFLADTRLKFMMNGNTRNKGASMACCMVYWGDNKEKFINVFSKYGQCVEMIH